MTICQISLDTSAMPCVPSILPSSAGTVCSGPDAGDLVPVTAPQSKWAVRFLPALPVVPQSHYCLQPLATIKRFDYKAVAVW